MSGAHVATASRPQRATTAASVADWLRWALLVAWLLSLAYCIVYAGRPATLGQLERAVAAGDVGAVRVGPPALPAGAVGASAQQVQWRQGLWRHRAEVRMVAGADDSGEQADGGSVRRGRDLASVLRTDHPDLRITRASFDAIGSQLYGWYLPPWVSWLSLVLTVSTLMLLVGGPRPRWATHWAWFWLTTNPVGTLLFLVVSGPTPGVPEPRSPRIVLRGGWALVLAILLGSVLPTWSGS